MATYRADVHAVNDNRKKKRIKWGLTLFAAFIIASALLFFEGRRFFLDGLPELPTQESMWQLNIRPSVTLLDKNGDIIGHRGPYYGKPVKIAELPPYLPNAFLAIEDQRFFEHAGVDNKAILRAIFANFKAQDKVQGASTLTQQLVKNMVLTPEKTYKRKVQEAILSKRLETKLTKAEILELYMNRMYLGGSSYGVEAAAQRFYGKSARDVTLAEAAMLAGLPQAPSKYDPRLNLPAAQLRARDVLRAMVEAGMITTEQMSEAEANPAILIDREDRSIPENILGFAFDMASESARGKVGGKAVDLIIHTTLDRDMMISGHTELNKVIETHKKSRNVSEGALVTLSTDDAAMMAIIGGRDYVASKYNRAAQAERQPGSAFKAFVYAAALENGFTPGTMRVDQPVNIGGWKPENYTEKYLGPMTIRESLKLSINTVAAQVGAEIGPQRIVELANRFGIRSKLGAHYSIALGASEVTLVDMTGAYMVFANEGQQYTPYLVTKVTDTRENVLYARKARKGVRVYSDIYAHQMTSMLRDVVRSGTGYGARLGGRPIGGKTGTSQDFRDAWFVGFTAQYITGVWMGNDDNSPMKKVTGGLLPVDVWAAHMAVVHKGLPEKELKTSDPDINDPARLASIKFYQSLGDALVAERDLANGNKSGSAGAP
ncbi:transglycosylase domain-containing protein [Robiginitomaculum antarcticum]|uniref:transglycosylase domain-containing protein n=1 Tax=Robiginitomaculum antarcticum TaxID=437507 RepID=UPI00035F19F4|nr:PBP1A family penicillin-binding protein [Robiginitomaculum antarcticum]